MSGAAQNQIDPFASASSSSQSPRARTPPSTDDRDEIDFLGDGDDDSDHDIGRHGHVLDDDPFRDDNLDAPLSFKRKQNPSFLSAPSRFLSALTGSSSSSARPSQHRSAHSSPQRHAPSSIAGTPSRRPQSSNINTQSKDGLSQDWYAEGPGRRVGYEDMTAIDWIFEYTKERQRLRILSSGASGVLGYFQHLIDASQVWIILVLTGLLVGAIAAGIDVTSDWLGDLKLGFCSSGPEGGHFYLNKNFCCYGYDQGSHCAGWKSWSEALGVHAAGGRWFIEYFFYLVFSVRLPQRLGYRLAMSISLTGGFCTVGSSVMCCYSRTRVRHLCEA